MSRELFAGITVGNLTYLAVALLVGVAMALIMRLIAFRLKRRLRIRDKVSLLAQLVDDLEEPWLYG